jgi:hypothetical protein
MPRGARVQIERGKTLEMEKRSQWLCDGSGDRFPAIAVKGDPGAAAFAAWPKLDLKRTKDEPASASELKQIRKAVRERLKHAPKGRLEFAQAVSLDIDGDGKPERLFSITVGPHDEEYELSALFVGFGRAPENLLELHESSWDVWSVLGGVDLDGDGRLELVMESSYYEGGATMVESVDEHGEARDLGGVSCGS